jgi:hypothetical protein
MVKHDWKGATAEDREAVHLNPSNDAAHAFSAWRSGQRATGTERLQRNPRPCA